MAKPTLPKEGYEYLRAILLADARKARMNNAYQSLEDAQDNLQEIREHYYSGELMDEQRYLTLAAY